ncbi:hypothetical protein I3842_07G144300 [Carya illinoinensis]|uniref:Uncharacterized protein n=1 Tax=Carya illinoinensis TaxID=32201 RepID=A0A922EN58_CARIL|nr:hypothetical protein I3842_07G144300 [Carya illinoinensis]
MAVADQKQWLIIALVLFVLVAFSAEARKLGGRGSFFQDFHFGRMRILSEGVPATQHEIYQLHRILPSPPPPPQASKPPPRA